MSYQRIVWIDDDYDVIGPVVTPLKNEGFSFTVYMSYVETEKNLMSILDADCVIVDLILPPGASLNKNESQKLKGKEFLGLEIIRKLKEKGKEATPPILVFSASDNDADALKEFSDLPHLAKPVRPSELKEAVHSLLKKK